MTKSFQMLAISPVHHYILGLHLVWASRCTALIYLERALPKRVSIGLVYSVLGLVWTKNLLCYYYVNTSF